MSRHVELFPIKRDGAVDIDASALSSEVPEVLHATVGLYELAGFVPPWICYIAMCDGHVVGTCGFKSAPAQGRVEIAYFTFPAFEGDGVATATALELLALANRADPAVTVAAQTLTLRNASHRVLEKHGFTCIGTIEHPGDGTVLEWQRAARRVA